MALATLQAPETRSFAPDVLRAIDTNELNGWSAEKILIWSIDKFHPRLSLSASFGAAEGMVLLHMMHEIERSSRVFVIDTGRLPQATHDLIDRVRDRYDKEIEVIFPQAEDVQTMVRKQGMNLFYESLEKRKHCCHVRKVEPLRKYLAGVDAYVTGLRREQNVTRVGTPKLEIDRSHGGVLKINPIADWDKDRVWQYVRKHNIPTNRLHGAGYPSVGCDPCTRAIVAGDDERSGRWWWENPETKECGLHGDDHEQGSGI